MGCKPFWHRGLELLLLYILHHGILADGDVGCRFNINLCDSQTEVCYDDLAFGKCIPLYSNFEEEDLYQYNLDTEKLNVLQLQLQRLENEGYKWSHPYTQCILRTSLYNLRHRLEEDLQNCQYFMENNRYHLKDEDIVDEKDKETVPFAIVKFMPNSGNSYGEFANEIYYPPGSRDESTRLLTNDKEFLDLPYSTKNDPESEPMHQLYKLTYSSDPYNKYSTINDDDIYKKKLRKKSLSLDEIKGQLYHSEPYSVNSKTRYDEADLNLFKNALDDDNLIRKLNAHRHFQDTTIKSTNNLDFLNNDRLRFDGSYNDNFETASEEDYEKTFSRKYKHPTTSSIEFLNEEPLWKDNTKRHVNIYPNFDYQNKNLADMEMDLQRNDDLDLPREDALFTEGGMVQSLNPSNGPSDVDDAPFKIYLDDLDAILLRRELSGFKRRERLDVKKPGPLFSTNNHIFKMQTPITQKESITQTTTVQEDDNSDVPISLPVKKEVKNSVKSIEKSYKNVDTDHVYIEFQQEFHTWSEGERVVNEVDRLLDLNGTLKDIRVGRAEVTFKVTENNMNFNSTDVVNKIDDIRNNLRDTLGVDVIRAGIGDKAKLPATLEVPNDLEINSTLFGAIVAAGIAAAITAAVVTLVIVRRHAKSREKLAGLATPDPEASKDYQDLCRVRMQAKQTPEKQEPWRPSSSRENETNNFICDRSSTSSWTFDEPAFSNMDISTGHMVLSYMEDHLKNKDRLDQEWIALCSYGTSATDVAENDTNSKYNRPNASLPYDHSRIVLNELTNANNSNYINASTITDHDPRNPAYIATQGPLPETAADLWQLVWEQGSVVIVTLTRLTEDGRAMCHRYWPDQTEGSERYHIYEVHLVSEHPWCDDYLVRSFYLKNLLTGETRTVTQFHFLSWPDNGIPHSTKALLEFRRKVNKSYRGRSCPIVVHCSDGAGRTGTYCLIDMVLNRIAKGTKEIDIAATLEHIRDQRPNMVATKQQFEFVLMAVAEEVHAILKALSIPSNENVPTKENVSSSPTKSNRWL